MRFKNRREAGVQLAILLQKYADDNLVVYALPRGGVPLGVEIAKKLHAPFELVITKKIGHPGNPEYALCAIAEDGEPICNKDDIGYIDKHWLQEEIDRVRVEIKRRREKYFGEITHPDIEGKTAIIVDDGIATGYTMIAAIEVISIINLKKKAAANLVSSCCILTCFLCEFFSVLVLWVCHVWPIMMKSTLIFGFF